MSFFKLYLLLFYAYVCVACMCVCVLCACLVSTRTRREHQIPWSYSLLWVIIWLLGTKIVSAFKYWVNSTTPYCLLLDTYAQPQYHPLPRLFFGMTSAVWTEHNCHCLWIRKLSNRDREQLQVMWSVKDNIGRTENQAFLPCLLNRWEMSQTRTAPEALSSGYLSDPYGLEFSLWRLPLTWLLPLMLSRTETEITWGIFFHLQDFLAIATLSYLHS